MRRRNWGIAAVGGRTIEVVLDNSKRLVKRLMSIDLVIGGGKGVFVDDHRGTVALPRSASNLSLQVAGSWGDWCLVAPGETACTFAEV